MENRFTVRRGTQAPVPDTDEQFKIDYYELGWDKETKRLFIGTEGTFTTEVDGNTITVPASVPELVAPIYYYGMLANEATDMPSPENFPKGSILIIDN